MTSLGRKRTHGIVARQLAAVLLVTALVGASVPVDAFAAKPRAAGKDKKEKSDPREMQAREAFAAGSYKDALDIYTKLYAEKLHPTYLRNIGRCYQNLNEPERAISSFREYLRKAKDIPADERAEVEGYIREMEEQQRKNTAAAEAAAKPVPTPVPEPAPAKPVVLLEQPTPAPLPEPTPIYKKAWFWGVVGAAVVAATVGGLWAGGAFSSDRECPSGSVCR